MTCGKTLDGAFDIEADNLTVNESSDLRGSTIVDGPSKFKQDLDLQNPATSSTITLSASEAVEDYIIKLPPTQGTSGQFFTTDGLGNASWSSVTPTVGGVSYIAISPPDGFMTVNGLASDSTFTNKTFNLELSGVLPVLFGGTGLSTVGDEHDVLASNGSDYVWKQPTGTGLNVLQDSPTLVNPTTDTLILTNTDDSNSSSAALLCNGGITFSNLYGSGNRIVDAGALTPLLSRVFVNEIRGGTITAPMPYIPLEAITFHINGTPIAGTNVDYTGTQTYALKVTGDSLFTGSISTSESVNVAGTVTIVGKTTFNGFVAFGSTSLIPSAVVTNLIMGPTLPSVSALTPVPTRILGYSATLPPLEGYSLGWDIVKNRFGLQVNSIFLPTQHSYLDSTTLSFSLSGADKIVIDAGPLANSIKVLTEGGIVAGAFYSNPAVIYSGEFAIYSDNTTQNGAFIDKNNFALWENAVAPSIELDNEGTFTAMNIYAGNLIAGSFYTTSATAYSGEFAIYSDATEQNGAFIDKNDFSLWENATAPSIQLKNEGTYNTLNLFASNLLAGSFYTTSATAYSGELAIYSDATEQNGAFMDKDTLEFWGSFGGIPTRKVVLEASNAFTGQPELSFYQGALATVTLNPGGLKIQADASPLTFFAAGEFSTMTALPFVEIEYGSFVFNQLGVPVLTMTSTAFSTVSDYSMSTAQDFVLQSLGVDGTGSITLTALGAATSSVSILSASSANSTVSITSAGSNGTISLTAAGAASSISLTCAAGAGAITLSCVGVLTLSSGTAAFTLGATTMTMGAATITMGAATINMGVTTMTAGLLTITTPAITLNAANVATINVGLGGIGLNVAGGGVSLLVGGGLVALTAVLGSVVITSGVDPLGIGGITLNAILGDVEVTSAAGSVIVQAGLGAVKLIGGSGGVNCGEPSGSKIGHFWVHCQSGDFEFQTGNIEMYTYDNAAFTGPGNFILDTTGAFTGNIDIRGKARINLFSNSSISICTNNSRKITFNTQTSTSDYTWNFPDGPGTAGQALLSGGSGAMTWGGLVGTVTASGVLSSSGGTSPDISLTGIVPVSNGGTGLDNVGTVGQLLTASESNTNSAIVFTTEPGTSLNTIFLIGGTSLYPIGSFVILAGFTPTAINGTWKVVGGNSSIINVVTGVASATVLGTVTAKVISWANPSTSGTSLNLSGNFTCNGTAEIVNANPTLTIRTPGNTLGSIYFGNSGHGLFRSSANDMILYTTSASLFFRAAGSGGSNILAVASTGISVPIAGAAIASFGPASASTSNASIMVRNTGTAFLELAVVGVIANFSTSAAVGDVVLRSGSGSLILQVGGGASAVKITPSNNVEITNTLNVVSLTGSRLVVTNSSKNLVSPGLGTVGQILSRTVLVAPVTATGASGSGTIVTLTVAGGTTTFPIGTEVFLVGFAGAGVTLNGVRIVTGGSGTTIEFSSTITSFGALGTVETLGIQWFTLPTIGNLFFDYFRNRVLCFIKFSNINNSQHWRCYRGISSIIWSNSFKTCFD